MSPVQPLQWSEELATAAQDHCNDIGPRGLTGHVGSNGSQMDDRIERYGEWSGNIGENVVYDFEDALQAVIMWIVDDGVSNRGHRANLLGSQFKICGVGVGPHSDMTNISTVDYATTVIPKGGRSAPNVPSGNVAPKSSGNPSSNSNSRAQEKLGNLLNRYQGTEESKWEDEDEDEEDEMPDWATSCSKSIETTTSGRKKVVKTTITFSNNQGREETRVLTKTTTS